ncbi:MAG: lytic transglycosylase [Hyphomonadaceae bacterium]|nr:MAG: lytic transglycosylase [Hyphomonadaceae bacterium]KAF0185046.1 MAG: lytic transglycosylase [Hyphomonadaceae bacterium]
MKIAKFAEKNEPVIPDLVGDLLRKKIPHQVRDDKVLVALAIIALFLSTPASAQTHNVCLLLDRHPAWEQHLEDAHERWGIAKGAILAVMDQESRFRPTARNGVNYGYAQSNPRTWNWFRRDAHMPNASREDFGASAHFIGWHFKKMHARLGLAIDNVGAQYLAYRMGEGGYRRAGASSSAQTRHIANRAANFDSQLENCD